MIAAISFSCSKETFYFTSSTGIYHNNSGIIHPELNPENSLQSAEFTSPNVVGEITNIEQGLSENVSAAKRIKALYNSEIADVRTFRKEYKKIKFDYRQKFSTSSEITLKHITGAKSGGTFFGLISIISGIAGFLAYGIPLGVLAMVLGAIGLSKGKNKGLAIAGIALGFIDVLAVIIILGT